MTPDQLEIRLIRAVWALRKMPDKERAFMSVGAAAWPEMQSEPGTYPNADETALVARLRLRTSPEDIDDMQPALDLLQLATNREDMMICYWGAYDQDGEKQSRIRWSKVIEVHDLDMSRWTLKRHYDDTLVSICKCWELENAA